MLDVLSRALVISDFQVLTAVHGIDALEKYRAQSLKIQAVLTDHNMPLMNGLELVAQLRTDGYQGLIIIMYSHLTAVELQDYAEWDVAGSFQKPFEIGLLLSLLREKLTSGDRTF